MVELLVDATVRRNTLARPPIVVAVNRLADRPRATAARGDVPCSTNSASQERPATHPPHLTSLEPPPPSIWRHRRATRSPTSALLALRRSTSHPRDTSIPSVRRASRVPSRQRPQGNVPTREAPIPLSRKIPSREDPLPHCLRRPAAGCQPLVAAHNPAH